MTLVVASAIGETPDELYAACLEAAKWGDWVEVRLDGPSGLPWDLRPWFALAKPALATVRTTEDGGRSNAEDDVRAEVIRRALLAGAHAIDVEAASSSAKALVEEAHARGAHVVLSHHDLEGTPDASDLVAMLRRMRAMGADHAKVATMVRSPADAEALVRAALAARDEGIPAALMAVNDPFLRLLAPALGMSLAYGRVPGRPATATGQVEAPALRATHRQLSPHASGRTRLAVLIGRPVARSKSPAMMGAAFRATSVDAAYLALDVGALDLAAAIATLKASGALGANVTMPHKLAVVPHLDAMDASAQAAGAVNTIVLHEGRATGHNTDGAGALDALREARVAVDGKRVLVLGAGGAARGVASALREAGARVSLANRTAEKAKDAAAALHVGSIPWEDVPAMLQRSDVLVNCTTVGMMDDASPVAPTLLPAKGLVVLDAVYKKGGTTLVRDARAHGLVALGGETMLLHQAARAFTLWTGKAAPLDAMRAALEQAMREDA